jgi:hypothetical protein
MRYSYCWRTSPDTLTEATLRGKRSTWEDRYVVVKGTLADLRWLAAEEAYAAVVDRLPPQLTPTVHVHHWRPRTPVAVGQEVEARGRVVVPSTLDVQFWDHDVEAAHGRLHPASIAGLVVAAWGVFVFTLYLRTWIQERRAGRAP